MARPSGAVDETIVKVADLAKVETEPWRIETFKFSADAELDAKVRDVVGLYLNPPDNKAGWSQGGADPRERVVHPGRPAAVLAPQPPGHGDCAVGVGLDPSLVIQIVLKARWALHRQLAIGHLARILVALLAVRTVVTEEDDAELLPFGVIHPVVDSFLRRLIAEDRLVGLHEEVAPIEPGKGFQVGDWHAGAKHAVESVIRRPPSPQ